MIPPDGVAEEEAWPGLARRLRKAMDRRGFTVWTLSLTLRVRPTYLYKYLDGSVTPTPPILRALAKALRVRVGWLLMNEKRKTRRKP